MATVYRTTSESNVLSNYSSSPLSHCTTILPQNSSRSVPSTPLINNHSSSPPGSDHHLPPQDYVVVTGQKYKLRKTLRDEYKCSDGSSIGDHTRIVMLTKALEEAHKTIESQALELKKQEEYILQLEQQLVDSSNNTTTLHLLSRPRGGSHPTPPVMNSIQPIPSNRKKNRLQEAIQSTKIINCDDELDQLFDGMTKIVPPSLPLLFLVGPTTPSIDSSSKMNISPIEIQTIQPKFPDPSLYIAHDNPQLGKIVLDSFTKESTAAMSVMIETKDSEGFLRIILGEILYSGDSEAITSTLHQQVDTRGGQCLVCVNMTGYIFQLSTVERRVLTKTTDINLSPSSIINSIKFVNQSQLREFFNHCPARVDIILAPFHEGVWYPYWENSENDEGNSVNHTANIRKLAPQFRSSGIGYLRLGDDMSSYGTSFLSCDSMLTYFDNQQPSSTSSMTIQDHADVPISEDIDFLLGSLIDKISQSTKWSDRCQHLKAIADLLR